jgi:hypothetical protein
MNQFDPDSPLRKALIERMAREGLSVFQHPRPTGLRPLIKASQPQPVPRIPLRRVKPRVFVSFDYENDRLFKQALDMWDANKKFDFTFQSVTPKEIQSDDVGRVKAVLTTKVKEASHVLILVGKHANERHIDAAKIGCINWINFEVQQAILHKKKLVAVMLQPGNRLPNNLIGAYGKTVKSFNEKDIIQALSNG